MKLSNKEEFLKLKNRILCFILPIFGYPVIRGVTSKGGITIAKTKGMVIKNCKFL